MPKVGRSVPTRANDHKSLTGMDIASGIAEIPRLWKIVSKESRPLRFSVSRFLATVRGKPCVRGRRITVSDVLEYLASGMTEAEILADFPELTIEDIRGCLAFAAERERRLLGSVA